MQVEKWLKTWICLSFAFCWTRAARPRFDTSTDMGLVLVPADAEVGSAIFRLRATDQDADFPLVFDIVATTTPIVKITNLPCTLYNKVCQANVILTKRLIPGRLHDFIVRLRDSKGDTNSMQATISVTNSTTPRHRVFPHIPTLVMVPEDTKPGKELDYLLVQANPWSGKPVYIELWQPKELFKIRQRQTSTQTHGIITLIGELDFETQSMYTLTMYATDPYTELDKDTRNIAGLQVVVIVQDVQDVPPIFTLAPPLTKINNTVKPGDVIVRVHAEDGDKGVPREVTYGLISEGNPFTPFFNVSELTGEIILARPLEELTQITHVGAPIVLKIVAEEIRKSRDEPQAQATVVEIGLLLGEPGNSPPYFENDKYVASLEENAEPGSVVVFASPYITKVKDEDIGKAGVFALKLDNNNGTFEISPAVAEKSANFIITVRNNSLIDYETYRSLQFKIIAQEVGPATNLSTSVTVTIFLKDINDNPPEFEKTLYNISLAENSMAGTKITQVRATDKDAGLFGNIQYTRITGSGSEAFVLDPNSGLICVSMVKSGILDRESSSMLELGVEARDEDGRGLRGVTKLIIYLLDVNDNFPIFEKSNYDFMLNTDMTNFTSPAILKATDADSEPPNNIVRYEIIHGNYGNKFQLDEITGELTVREFIQKPRKIRENGQPSAAHNLRTLLRTTDIDTTSKLELVYVNVSTSTGPSVNYFKDLLNGTSSEKSNISRTRRADNEALFTITARAYDLGVPHLSNTTQIRILRSALALARIVMFVMKGENPDPKKTAEALTTITGGHVTIMEIRPYVSKNSTAGKDKKSVIIARIEQNDPESVVDLEKIRKTLEAMGGGIIDGTNGIDIKKNETIIKEITSYKAENKLLMWLLIILGVLLLLAIILTIICCICPTCPFYMEPRKRRIHSSETLITRSDGRPKRHLHRKPIHIFNGYLTDRKQAWSADPTRRNWQFNRRNLQNYGQASLPGDIVPGYQHPDIKKISRLEGSRKKVGPSPIFNQNSLRRQRLENERICVEEIAGQTHVADLSELDSIRRHELERGSDIDFHQQDHLRIANQGIPDEDKETKYVQERFYRDGNAEVLQLVSRDEIFDNGPYQTSHYQTNGKDILLQRFIEDQNIRKSHQPRVNIHSLGGQATESYQNDVPSRQEILILPEKLDMHHQRNYQQSQQEQYYEQPGTDIQRLILDRNISEQSRKTKSKDPHERKAHHYETNEEYQAKKMDDIMKDEQKSRKMNSDILIDISKDIEDVKDARDKDMTYSVHDVELARQNALLTRLLLEREIRGFNVAMIDTSSLLETQSLPGQVAIATQTDRTASTQTDFIIRSRSDNEESEEDARLRKKLRAKKKQGMKEECRPMKSSWKKSPIPEECSFDNKKTFNKRRIVEPIASREISLSPDVLKEISDSIDDNTNGFYDEFEKRKEDMRKREKEITKSVLGKRKMVIKALDDSTPSPEEKDTSPVRNTTRRKVETEGEGENRRRNFMEPSFRVIEREINSFQQKIRKFSDKKHKSGKVENVKQKSSDNNAPTDIDNKNLKLVQKNTNTKKNVNAKTSVEASPSKLRTSKTSKVTDETNLKQRQFLKQQQNVQSISSSELEDSEPKKRVRKSFLDVRGFPKLKRQTKLDSETKSNEDSKDEDQISKTKISKSISSTEGKVDSNSSSSKETKKMLSVTKPTKEKAKPKKIHNVENKELKCQLTSTSKESRDFENISLEISDNSTFRVIGDSQRHFTDSEGYSNKEEPTISKKINFSNESHDEMICPNIKGELENDSRKFHQNIINNTTRVWTTPKRKDSTKTDKFKKSEDEMNVEKRIPYSSTEFCKTDKTENEMLKKNEVVIGSSAVQTSEEMREMKINNDIKENETNTRKSTEESIVHTSSSPEISRSNDHRYERLKESISSNENFSYNQTLHDSKDKDSHDSFAYKTPDNQETHVDSIKQLHSPYDNTKPEYELLTEMNESLFLRETDNPEISRVPLKGTDDDKFVVNVNSDKDTSIKTSSNKEIIVPVNDVLSKAETASHVDLKSNTDELNSLVNNANPTLDESDTKTNIISTTRKGTSSPQIVIKDQDTEETNPRIVEKIKKFTARQEAEDSDSSIESDMSRKTALYTKPYRTPRHSFSSHTDIDESETISNKVQVQEDAHRVQQVAADIGKNSHLQDFSPLQIETVYSSEYSTSPFISSDVQYIKSGFRIEQNVDNSKTPPPKPPRVTASSPSMQSPSQHAMKKTEQSGNFKQHEMQKSEDNIKSQVIQPSIAPVKVIPKSDVWEKSGNSDKGKSAKIKQDEKIKDDNIESCHGFEDKLSIKCVTQISSQDEKKTEEEHLDTQVKIQNSKHCISHRHYQSRKTERTETKEIKEHQNITESNKERESHQDSRKDKKSHVKENHSRRPSDQSTDGTKTNSHMHEKPQAFKLIDHGKDPEIANARSRYMAWYEQKRLEMNKKREEKSDTVEKSRRPRWLNKVGKTKKSNTGDGKSPCEEEQSKSPLSSGTLKCKIKPLVNVESEQLKAIVRQGRKMRKSEGMRGDDLPVQIFAPDKPPPHWVLSQIQPEPRHPLVQHSEYNFEKTPTGFYLHPPPVPHPSPEHYTSSGEIRRPDDDLDSGIAVSLQGGTRLRHQQLLDKKSVFDIAYREAAPTHLRSDSSTPPS